MKKQKVIAKESSNFIIPIILLLVVLTLGVYIVKTNDVGTFVASLINKQAETEPTEEQKVPEVFVPKASPIPLPNGKQTWTYSPGPLAKGPKIYEFSLDPLDVTVGQTQTITVKARYPSPISAVSARLDTDTKKTTYTFTKVGGSDTDSTWETTVTADDTHNTTYYIDFTLVSTPETYTGGFAFR